MTSSYKYSHIILFNAKWRGDLQYVLYFLVYNIFKNSLIIHKENTKEITTVAVVLYVIKPHMYFLKT